jgi:mycothiol S-conjugate amidase
VVTVSNVSSRELANEVEVLRFRTPEQANDGGILFILAHPDDETFLTGGTIARYASLGTTVKLVCATRGEAGTVDPAMTKRGSIGEIRAAELACAARQVGLEAVYFAGFRDSGMAGSPDAANPGSLFQAPLGEIANRLATIIRDVRPRIVVTHGQYGEYGHPDHIRLHEATRLAFELLGEDAHSQSWMPDALYAITINPVSIRATVRWFLLLRRDPRRFGRNGDVDLVAIVENALPATCAIDTRAWLAVRDRASSCHRSQLGGRRWLNLLPRRLRRRFEGTELYVRLHPPILPGEPIQDDLFGGIGKS